MYFYLVSIEMLAVGAGAGVDKAWARDRFIVLIYRQRLALCIIYAPTLPLSRGRFEKPANIAIENDHFCNVLCDQKHIQFVRTVRHCVTMHLGISRRR